MGTSSRCRARWRPTSALHVGRCCSIVPAARAAGHHDRYTGQRATARFFDMAAGFGNCRCVFRSCATAILTGSTRAGGRGALRKRRRAAPNVGRATMAATTSRRASMDRPRRSITLRKMPTSIGAAIACSRMSGRERSEAERLLRSGSCRGSRASPCDHRQSTCGGRSMATRRV